MRDLSAVALPQRELRWQGFRKVRRQVCKRVKRRMNELGVADFAAYRAHLAADPAEWEVFEECCHFTISRFFRDRGVFDALRRQVLPSIAARAAQDGSGVRIWSAGCASGEEPYTVKVLWDLEVAQLFRDVPISIIATDIDQAMLARARKGCYGAASLRELPSRVVDQAFSGGAPPVRAPAASRRDRLPLPGPANRGTARVLSISFYAGTSRSPISRFRSSRRSADGS